jgi:hypothetical protein
VNVEGFVPVLLTGIVGGVIAEVIKIGTALRAGTRPSSTELIASVIFAILGGGAVFYGTESTPAIEVAHLGAAFPLLFSAAVAVLTQPTNTQRGTRSVTDYISFRM